MSETDVERVVARMDSRIEDLQAENDKLRAERDAATGAFHMANEWIAELKAEVARLTAALAAEESRSGLMAEALKGAAKALGPIARLAEGYAGCGPSEWVGPRGAVYVSDIRVASETFTSIRATLTALKEKTDDQA